MALQKPSKTWWVVIVCVVLFLLNAAWLAFLEHSDRSQLHASPFYPVYLSVRSLLLRPLSLTLVITAVSVWLIGFLRSPKKPSDASQRLVVLAILLCTIFGIILMALFKL